MGLNSTFFEETNRFGEFGRTGVLHTRAGDVLTPTFMPDGTRGAVKGLTPQQVADTGVGIVLANTYHLHLSPGEQVVKQLGGLHAFANRKGPMLTDSGGFQVFSLGQHTKITEEGVHFKDPKTGDKRFISPEKSIQIQLDLGADMIVAFDHLIGLGEVAEGQVRDAFDRTHRWLDRCIVEFKRLTKDMTDRPLLFGVVQGGLDIELRKQSLDIVQNSDVDGVAIGGLSVGETREEMETVLKALAPLYRADKPRFLLGVGTPEDLRIAVENGIDMLDCVLPTRNARHGMVWIKLDQRMNLTNAQYTGDSKPIMRSCDCYTCASGFSRSFLRHQFKSGDPIAGSLASIHNLRYMMRICEGYRNQAGSIAEDDRLIYDIKVRCEQVTVQLERVEGAVTNYLKVVESAETSGNQEDASHGLYQAGVLADLDTHTLLVVLHSLFKMCRNANFNLRNFENMRQEIEILRDNFEHWDENSVYFRDKTLNPKNSASRYMKLQNKKGSTGSPRGYYYVESNNNGLQIVVGDLLELSAVRKLLAEILNLTDLS